MSVCIVPLPAAAVHWGPRAETSNGTFVFQRLLSFHLFTYPQKSELTKSKQACVCHFCLSCVDFWALPRNVRLLYGSASPMRATM